MMRRLKRKEKSSPGAALPPEELLVHVASFIATPWDLCSLSQVCVVLAEVSRDESLWRPFGNEVWLASGHVTPENGWRGAYTGWLRQAVNQYMTEAAAEKALAKKYGQNACSYDYLFKILLIGDSYVGKTSLLDRYVNKRFEDTFRITLGVDFLIRMIEREDKTIKMQLWDTNGRERFTARGLESYYRGCHCIGIVYDITCRQSFDSASQWKGQMERYSRENVVVILIGNKRDDDSKRAVTEDEGRKVAAEWGVPFFECSAKTGEAVSELFAEALELMVYRYSWRFVPGMARPASMPGERVMEMLRGKKYMNKKRCCLQ